jgi:dTDP-3-amino-2,3,6-trideoxy-4-keto-D-glucose/dTDP-3-amino-3,4,6-trideoxy-alpha-D-glucose/dTDP-2,6-dideoxy-D-kanosamine transaminase
VTVPAAAPTRLAAPEAVAVSEAMERVVRDGPWILGPEVSRFEADWGAYADLRHAVGVGNGTDALAVAFAALGLAPGAGVLLAANEGGYAATAARMVGLVPVAMDVDPATMAPTVATAQAAHEAGVEALVVTHLHGDAVDVEPLDAWRRTHGLALVEDCAQAHGLRVRGGEHVGARADAATYSFYPTKNLGAVGDAGLVGFTDDAVAARARSLRQYGWGERFRADLAGGRNTRLDPLQAAVLSARLPFLDDRNLRRRAIAATYAEALGSAARLHGDRVAGVAHHAVVVSERRDELAAHLGAAGIGTAVHYPHLVGEMPGLAARGATAHVAGRLREEILSLPCFPELTDPEVASVFASLSAWAEQA